MVARKKSKAKSKEDIHKAVIDVIKAGESDSHEQATGSERTMALVYLRCAVAD